MRQIDDAVRMLTKLQKGYGQSLGRVDHLLRSAVAQDPACLADAKAVQARYADLPKDYFEPAVLAPLLQPEVAHNDPHVRPAESDAKVDRKARGRVEHVAAAEQG